MFDANAGKLGCEKDAFQGRIAGKLKGMAYNGSELITTNNR